MTSHCILTDTDDFTSGFLQPHTDFSTEQENKDWEHGPKGSLVSDWTAVFLHKYIISVNWNKL